MEPRPLAVAGHSMGSQAEASFRITPDEPGVDERIYRRLAAHAVMQDAGGEWRLRFDRGALNLEGSRVPPAPNG
jgi:hypothetical protein